MATKDEQGYYKGNLSGAEARSNFALGMRNTFPLGAPIGNIRLGNPYLDQVKEIDKELKRLDKIVREALKGSDNQTRDLKILNHQLRISGDLNRNKLGIDRRFWSRRTIQAQMRALQERRNKLTDFLGQEDIKGGSIVPTIKGFTPTFIKDLDSYGGVSKINAYYNPYFDENKKKKHLKIYNSTKADFLRSTDTSGMSQGEIDKAIQSELPQGNFYKSDSKFYIGNVNEYGEKKTTPKSANGKDQDVVENNNNNNRRSGRSYSSGDGLFPGNTSRKRWALMTKPERKAAQRDQLFINAGY